MPDSNQKDNQVYDKRTVAWYIKNGRFNQETYDKYLQKLPDSASKAEALTVEQPRDAERVEG